MGTVNILEAVRQSGGVKAVVNVTTDKVYENFNRMEGYKEEDRLGGYDPYSNSKACSELVTASYRSSFFNVKELDKHGCGIATARAGNVLGGGDWAEDRLLPDCVRAALKGEKIVIRSGGAIRPWQHVLEPVISYLKIAESIIKYGGDYCTGFNIGPDVKDCRPVIEVIKIFCRLYGEGMDYAETNPCGFHEAGLLVLDNSKAKKMLGFRPKYGLEETVKKVVDWTKAYRDGKNMFEYTLGQVKEYL
jgi:CDP-glucose 4,6-dehydratase